MTIAVPNCHHINVTRHMFDHANRIASDISSISCLTSESFNVLRKTQTFTRVLLEFLSTHHEELAESDVGENVVGFVFATSDPALLPEVGELVLKWPTGSQVEDELPGQRVVQERVVHMGKQPRREVEVNGIWEKVSGLCIVW